MNPTLTPLGMLTYNGFTFPSDTETTDVAIRPVYDASGRTVVSNTYRLAFRFRVTGSPTDTQIVNLRRVLTHPGKPFVCRNRGLGDLSVNVNSRRDVNWGPKPQELSFKYLGRDNACEVTWQVEFSAPDCQSATYSFAPMEFVYRLRFALDRSGYTTRTYSGHVKVPLTRFAGRDRFPNDSADAYRDKVYPPLMPGFRRIPGEWELSEDRTTLTFTIVDEQMPPTVPGPDIVDCSASHTVESSGGLQKWNWTIEGEYEVARGKDKGAAINSFVRLYKDRVAHMRRAVRQFNPNQRDPLVLANRFSMSEPEIYGRKTARFSISGLLATCTLEQIFAASGFWRPVPDSDWTRWATSMASTLGPRGNAQLVFDPNEDKIVDPCDPEIRTPSTPPTGRDKATLIGELFTEPCPPRRFSWLAYQNELIAENDSGTAELRTLPDEVPVPAPPKTAGVLQSVNNPRALPPGQPPGFVDDAATGWFIQFLESLPRSQIERVNRELASGRGVETNANGGFPPWFPDGGGGSGGGTLSPTFTPPPPPEPPVRVQQRTAPLVYVTMVGSAARVCYPIAQPELTDIGGVRPIPANRLDRGEGFRHAMRANFGHPVYVAKWRLRYALPAIPSGGLPAPPNPFYSGGE